MQTIFFNYHKALAKSIEIHPGSVLVMGENITKASRIGGLGKIDSAEFTSLEYLKKIHVITYLIAN